MLRAIALARVSGAGWRAAPYTHTLAWKISHSMSNSLVAKARDAPHWPAPVSVVSLRTPCTGCGGASSRRKAGQGADVAVPARGPCTPSRYGKGEARDKQVVWRSCGGPATRCASCTGPATLLLPTSARPPTSCLLYHACGTAVLGLWLPTGLTPSYLCKGTVMEGGQAWRDGEEQQAHRQRRPPRLGCCVWRQNLMRRQDPPALPIVDAAAPAPPPRPSPPPPPPPHPHTPPPPPPLTCSRCVPGCPASSPGGAHGTGGWGCRRDAERRAKPGKLAGADHAATRNLSQRRSPSSPRRPRRSPPQLVHLPHFLWDVNVPLQAHLLSNQVAGEDGRQVLG